MSKEIEEQKPWQETINYVVKNYEDGKVAYTGQSINYGVICSSWESVEDLQKKMKAMIEMWLEHGKDTLQEPLLMKELTHEEWEAREDNIVFWEMERTKRLMKKPEVSKVWIEQITKALLNADEGTTIDDQATLIMEALINQPNE